MKFSADAGKLASALAHAAALADSKVVKKIPAAGAVRLTAGDGAVVVVTTNNLDAEIRLSTKAEIIEPGELAVSAERLAALTAGFAKESTIEVGGEDKAVTVKSGRSRFRLPIVPVAELPSLALGEETGRTVIARDDVLALFVRPAFAFATEQTRFYLTGLLLHDMGGDLAAVATDGHRLARAIVKAAGTLSSDRRCLVPAPAVKAITKLLAAHRELDEVTLRRSSSLFEIGGGPFRLVSKLIDATYPAYEKVIGNNDGNNVVVVDRADLAAAFARIAAVAGNNAVAGLAWEPEQEGLHLCAVNHDDAAQDVVTVANISGQGRIAFKVGHGLELLDAFDADTVAVDAGTTAGVPIWITDGADSAGFLVVQMPCAWRGGSP